MTQMLLGRGKNTGHSRSLPSASRIARGAKLLFLRSLLILLVNYESWKAAQHSGTMLMRLERNKAEGRRFQAHRYIFSIMQRRYNRYCFALNPLRCPMLSSERFSIVPKHAHLSFQSSSGKPPWYLLLYMLILSRKSKH